MERNPDGSYRRMNQYDADTYCKGQGLRLPTIRELAQYAQNLGAKGISETEKDGHRPVAGSDSSGNPDHFYFSFEGYKRPTGELGSFWVWSSSVSPFSYPSYAFGLNGSNGTISIHTRSEASSYDDYGVVRCVP